MIIQIDDNYFNPLQITTIQKQDNNVLVYFDGDYHLTFSNWSLNDLAAEINRCIELFNEPQITFRCQGEQQ